MGIRGILRAAVLLLLIRTWLAEGNEPSPTPKFHFELSPTVPEVILNLFNCKKCANEGVVHKILDRVLSNYDVRLRPNFGGAPVPVGVSMYVSSIEQISEMTMDYTITMFFHQTWKDPRLAYHETDLNLTLDYRMLEKLWVPDCYFLNSKDAFVHDVTVENRVFQLHPDGTVRYGMRLTTTAACSLDLQKFPLDKQTCKLEVESYGYTVEDIVLYWEGNGNAIQGTEKLHIPQFSFLGKTMSSKEVFFYTGSYVRLILRFLVQREVTSYLVQIYWPTVLTTVVSWISFWMNYESSAARVTVGLTSMLILNAINSHLRDKLPQVACIKAIDIYMVVCFLFVFLSLLEYVYINYLYYSRGGSRRNQRRRRRARRVMARYRYREVMLQPFANRRSQEEMILSVEEIDTHIATVDEESPLSPPPSPPPVLIHVGLANPDAINVSTISLREDQISIEDESGSLSSRPARACLASLESLSSLTSIPGQAPLATAESLSSLSSLSELASLASRESLSDLPSTPEQAPHRYGIHVNGFENDDSVTPTEMRNLAEAHDHAEISDPEDPEENFSLDESPVHIPSGRPLLLYGHRRVREASCSLDEIRSNLNEIRSNLDEIRSLPDDIRVESGYLDLEKQLRYDLYNWRPNAKKFMRLNRRKDSNSESDDSCPPSPGCSFTEGFSSKLFDPDYVPKVDKWSRILFPLAFVVFNIVYWAYHLN